MAKEITSGSKIHLVLANGKHVDATVTKTRKNNLVDLEAQLGEETVTITSSPLDETGKKPDSWHAIEEIAAAASEPEKK